MAGIPRSWGRMLWLASLAGALAFVAYDSAVRLDRIRALNQQRITEFAPPRPDPSSPSGYAFGQHDLILPALGADGYQWILQSDRARGDGGLRLREVDYDNAPGGREVHWASALRWWAAGLASAYRVSHPDVPAPLALARVAPWANTLLASLLIAALTALLAWQLGSGAAAVFALGSVSAYPLYEYLVAGYFDHHAVATLAAVAAVLLIVIGGAGWVRAETSQADAGERGAGSSGTPRGGRTPSPFAATRWFAAAAAAGATGLWISAATAAPVLLGIGLAALACMAWFVDAPTEGAAARFEPDLWRTWGAAGAACSLAFYAVEYLPAHAGWRLEVNHPLYALAWLGGGDLLARLGAWRQEALAFRASGAGPASALAPRVPARERLLMSLDALLVLLLPAAVLALGESGFTLTNRFLFAFHDRSIVEFLSLAQHLSLLGRAEILAGVSALPLVMLPAAALLVGSDIGRGRTRRVLLIVAAALGIGFALTLVVGLLNPRETPAGPPGAPPPGPGAVRLLLTALVSAGLAHAAFAVMPRFRVRLGAAQHARIACALVPSVIPLALALEQVRWLGLATALSLALLAVLVSLVSAGDLPMSRGHRTAAVALLTLVLAPYPLYALNTGATARIRGPSYSADDVEQLATRELAHWLRARVGGAPAVVFAGPTTTSRLIYFGGFQGLGTLYWENLEGLRQSASLASARTWEEAHAAIRAHGVTHLVFLSWDSGPESLREAAEGEGAGDIAAVPGAPPAASARGSGASPDPVLLDLRRDPGLTDPSRLPAWLNPLAYPIPQVGVLAGATARVYEVVEDQSPEAHLVRMAEFYRAIGADERAVDALRESLRIRPDVPALALFAQLQHLAHDDAGFAGTITALRASLEHPGPLSLADHMNVVIALGMAGDLDAATRELGAALAAADEHGLRRTPPESLGILVEMSRRLGVGHGREALIELASELLPGGTGASAR